MPSETPSTRSRSSNSLTVIIPFLNEGEELGNTLKSIRETAGMQADILVINDASDDRVDYRTVARRYRAGYIQNRRRLGVAASRDKGVALCTTPYFLFLDAHMRFYQNDWAGLIVEELEKDDRVLLCCDTKVLTKDNNGRIDSSDASKAFGATINLSGNKWMLNSEWNLTEHEPGSPAEDIACVLGAAYAASKRYWQYLRGLEGLVRYGSDEPYISLKVWLEGGRCRLMKNIRTGHIYRKQAPYKIETADSVFNKLWIAELLLPFAYKLRTFGALYEENPHDFKAAFQLLNKKRKQIKALRQYYRQIFTVEFEKIIRLNCREKTELSEERKEKLSGLFKKALLNCNTLPSYGLFSGRMGCLLFLVRYDHLLNEDRYEDLTGQLIDEVYAKVENSSMSIDLAEGLCGIAYGLSWLVRHRLMGGDLNEILEEADRRIMERDPLRMTDYSLQSGLAGILYYVLYRLQIACEEQQPLPFDQEYLGRLYKAALKTGRDPEKSACFEMASWLVAYMQDRSLPLRIPDIIQLLNLDTLRESSVFPRQNGLRNGWSGYGLSKLTE